MLFFSLTVEKCVYALLVVKVNTDNQSVKVTLTQGGLTKKVLKAAVILDSNKKINTEERIPLIIDTNVTPFDEPW